MPSQAPEIDGVVYLSGHAEVGTITPVRVADPTRPVSVTMPAIVHRFAPGHQVRLVVASGDLNYNQYHNVFGPYGAFQVNLSGQEQQVMLLSAPDLAAATP